MEETDGRDSYCKAKHLTGLLGGAESFLFFFSFFLHMVSQISSQICVSLLKIHDISSISPVVNREF